MGTAGLVRARRVRRSSGGERNLPAVVRAVLQLEWKWRHQLRLYLVRAVHDDRDARLRRLLRAESMVPGLRPWPTGSRNRRSAQAAETLAGRSVNKLAGATALL